MKSQTKPAVRHRSTVALISGALCLTLAATFLPHRAVAQDGHLNIDPAELSSSRHVSLGLGKSLVIDLPRDARDVLVASPSVADAVMRTARRAYLIGNEVGQTNVFFFDGAGRQIAVLEVNVSRDTSAISQTIRRLIPGSTVQVESAGDNVVLTGSVRNPEDAKQAAEIAGRYVGDPTKVLNMLAADGSEQVHLKVTIAEVKRNVLKQFGVNLNIGSTGTDLVSSVVSNPAFALGNSAVSPVLNAALNWTDGTTSISAVVEALEQQGLMRILAEPTLSAISGESAEFLAGGEFPVPVGNTCDADTGQCQLSIEFKPFGVGLAFVPVVMSGGRISLKVKTEVSELSNETAVVLEGVSIPGLNVRRADTTVELPSGGALVLAGLLQQDTKTAYSGVPGLKDLPVLGTLFRSRDFLTNETELVVIATPYLVKPVARDELTRPDKNLEPASDPVGILLGRFNRLYGVAGTAPQGSYQGQIGFIVE